MGICAKFRWLELCLFSSQLGEAKPEDWGRDAGLFWTGN